MELYQLENLSFSYPNAETKVLDDVSFRVRRGEFITLCGKSGCGKTTLLRLLKSVLAPSGTQTGTIFYNGKPLGETAAHAQAAEIGFVTQNPDNQIVTDKVWHELAFGLESLGVPTAEIRTRVAETASFFGIQTWFHQKVTDLSGGQKQLLNLASVMVMRPSVLILDEPTAQLDPIAADEFIKTLEKINRELGTAVILSEHRLEEVFPLSDRVIVLDNGKIIADASPRETAALLQKTHHDMREALPAAARISAALGSDASCPLTVREGKRFLEQYAARHLLDSSRIPAAKAPSETTEAVISLKDVWFRYEKNSSDVIRGLNMTVRKGELFAIVGGNGVGKTTALSLISGLLTPYRGTIRLGGAKLSDIPNLYRGLLGVLPQNPQSVFVKKTVYLDLMDALNEQKLPKEDKERRLQSVCALCRLEALLTRHPYDLSGGEQQRAALAKILLLSPQILLLDEPTKGLDAHFKQIFADILHDLQANGVTVVMVSHDIEFCAAHADRCAMLFDGTVTACDAPRAFFTGNTFYTTAAHRMAQTLLPNALLAEDVTAACGIAPHCTAPKRPSATLPSTVTEPEKPKTKRKFSPMRIFVGIGFALLFLLTFSLRDRAVSDWAISAFQITTVLELAVCLVCFLPHKEIALPSLQQPRTARRLTRRSVFAACMILLAVPFTIYIGTFYLGNRKYYFISLLLLFETMLPFALAFEHRKPQARELVIIGVLCALTVAGRAAFFMLPQFKPVTAMVIIAGICFGGETGFLVGAIAAFVSNFYFGQGAWTPWQMFCFGIIGFLAGILFRKGWLRKTRVSLCLFGFFATLLLYGGIMNPASVIMYQENPTISMLLASYTLGLPYDLIHAVSTAFFLWFLAEPMTEKLERMKIKYGLTEQ